jgi:hypothetical protein
MILASERLSWYPKQSKLVSRVLSSSLVRIYLCVVFLWGFTSSKVLNSTWAGDDWPNSQTPYWVKWRFGEISISNIWNEAMYWNKEWMNGQGRFYPLQWIESRFVFSYFRELWQYKFFEMLVLLISGLLLAYLIFLISESHEVTVLFLLLLSITVQFRRDFDPHLSYAFLVPSLLVKVFLAAIIIFYSVKSESIKIKFLLSFFAGIMYFGAMSTYEYAFLLFPVLGITLISGVHRKFKGSRGDSSFRIQTKSYIAESWVFIPTLVAWIGYSILVFGVLRKNATSISGSYELGVSWSSVPVFFKQVFLPLPLNNFNPVLDLSYLENPSNLFLLLIVARLSFVFFFRNFAQEFYLNSNQIKENKVLTVQNSSVFGYLLGFVMLLSVGFMLSLQPAWWGVADTRHGYLGVLIQEYGFTIILAYLIRQYFKNMKISSQNKKRSRK